jgi:hypothetical protein
MIVEQGPRFTGDATGSAVAPPTLDRENDGNR